MPEPIWFNTGFVYRFGTDGVIDFGGEEDGLIDVDTVTWTQDDIPIVWANLQKLKEDQNLPDVNFSSYNKNINGTHDMIADLLVKGNFPKEYLLGCTIWHQLQFKVPLEGTFTTGQTPSEYGSDLDSTNSKITYRDYDSDSYSE